MQIYSQQATWLDIHWTMTAQSTFQLEFWRHYFVTVLIQPSKPDEKFDVLTKTWFEGRSSQSLKHGKKTRDLLFYVMLPSIQKTFDNRSEQFPVPVLPRTWITERWWIFLKEMKISCRPVAERSSENIKVLGTMPFLPNSAHVWHILIYQTSGVNCQGHDGGTCCWTWCSTLGRTPAFYRVLPRSTANVKRHSPSPFDRNCDNMELHVT